MWESLPNIIQSEFFHPNDSSLDELVEDCERRIEEGSKIKTVVRFYDVGNEITDYVVELNAAYAEFDELHLRFATGSVKELFWFRRMVLAHRLRKLSKGAQTLKESLVPLLVRHLTAKVLSNDVIGIECFDFSFRVADHSELHELRESAASAKNAWVFIYVPGMHITEAGPLLESFI